MWFWIEFKVELEGGRLFLYTQKTGTPVRCVLPEFVVQALEAAPRSSSHYYFWTGASTIKSAVGKWQHRLRRLFKLAKVHDGHAHRFRDTYAVELLLANVPLERVSVLLGHSSVRVTEKHYAPWTKARQEQLEADITQSWRNDAVLLSQKMTGTKKVQFEKQEIN